MPPIESRKRREFVTSRLRLRDFDYSSPGYYFVTICCQNRMPLFGEIRDGEMHLNEPGEVVAALWDELPPSFHGVSISDHIVMPNHIHLLLRIDTDPDGQALDAPTISQVIQQMKGIVTKRIGWPIWQKLFHDHVIRNERDYLKIWEYIEYNPIRWKEDCFFIDEGTDEQCSPLHPYD